MVPGPTLLIIVSAPPTYLQHEEGAVSMANYGSPHTNNSQFFITVVPCSHLDGTNVVVGYVLRGMGILKEMEKFTTDSFKPMVEIVVEECGVLSAHGNWHYYDPDDQLPPFPADWVEMNDKIKSYMCVENLLKQMRDHANLYYSKKEYVSALRHYKKMKRYYHVLKELPLCDHSLFQLTLSDLNLTSNANMAACQLKLGQYKDVVKLCTAVLIKEPDNVKALYRKGVAEVHLMNYDEGLQNLKEAHSKEPHDPLILKEFQNGKELMLAYRQFEKASIRKMFPELTATPVTPPPHCPTTATSPADTEMPSSSAVSPTSSSTQHSLSSMPSFSTD